MKATTIGLAATALLVSGCVVREVREIHHVRDNGSRAPGDTASSGDAAATCDGCDAGDAPGAVMADSQPPPPLVEEALDQPGDGYVWTDGYWHWDGSQWVWIPGTWYPPVEAGVVFIPPAYYTSGGSCLYVPGRWGRDRRVVRDHRTRRPDRDDDGKERPVRDHRTVRKDRDGKDGRQRPVRDHRGEQPVAPPDVDRGLDPGRDVVIRVPPRRFRARPASEPDAGAPVRTADDDLIRVDPPEIDGRMIDTGDRSRDGVRDDGIRDDGGRAIDAGRLRDDMGGRVFVRPRPERMTPDRRPDGTDVRPGGRGFGRPDRVTPDRGSPDRGAPVRQGRWHLPSRGGSPLSVPPSRGGLDATPPRGGPVMVPPSRGPSPARMDPPGRTMSPRPMSPPPRQAPPAAGQPRSPSQPASNRAPARSNSPARTGPAPRMMGSPRR